MDYSDNGGAIAVTLKVRHPLFSPGGLNSSFPLRTIMPLPLSVLKKLIVCRNSRVGVRECEELIGWRGRTSDAGLQSRQNAKPSLFL